MLRQISHKNQVAYEYKIKYNHSKHYIEYTFTLPTTEPPPKIEYVEKHEID